MRREFPPMHEEGLLRIAPAAGRNTKVERKIRLYRLVNNGYFFLRYVFIVEDDGNYRLVVIHDNRLLTDRLYKSLSHAKSAFGRMYNRKAWKKGVKPEWSTFFPPGAGWIKNKIECSM